MLIKKHSRLLIMSRAWPSCDPSRSVIIDADEIQRPLEQGNFVRSELGESRTDKITHTNWIVTEVQGIQKPASNCTYKTFKFGQTQAGTIT
jgi:hypothetical protein